MYRTAPTCLLAAYDRPGPGALYPSESSSSKASGNAARQARTRKSGWLIMLIRSGCVTPRRISTSSTLLIPSRKPVATAGMFVSATVPKRITAAGHGGDSTDPSYLVVSSTNGLTTLDEIVRAMRRVVVG